MADIRIAILDDYQGIALGLADWSSLPAGTDVQSFAMPARDEHDLVQRLRPYDVVVAMRERTAFPASVIDALPNLKLLASTGLRNAAIDLDACRRRGIVVSGARGARTGLAATAETAWALALALHKQVVPSHQALCHGTWQPVIARSLMDGVLGIAGLGNVGRRMARVGLAFGMKVIAWSPNLTQRTRRWRGCAGGGLDELFEQSDVLSLHLVLGPATAGLVSAERLARMKRDAVLINTARAGLVDEAALVDALQQRRIGGAGLDVFWQEPLPLDHPLCRLDNVVMTPHLGYVTHENLAAFYGGALENIKAWLDGRTPLLLAE